MYTQTDLNAIALFGKLQLQVILYPQKVSFKDMSHMNSCTIRSTYMYIKELQWNHWQGTNGLGEKCTVTESVC